MDTSCSVLISVEKIKSIKILMVVHIAENSELPVSVELMKPKTNRPINETVM
jgi:hypothetical protein